MRTVHSEQAEAEDLYQLDSCVLMRQCSTQFKLHFSIYSQCILITPLHREVFILANAPQENSLKAPQPLARFTFIILGRRASDCLELRPCFLNILNHLLSVFWQGAFFAVLFSRLHIMAEIQNVIESSVAFHTVNARLPRQQASCHYLSSEG